VYSVTAAQLRATVGIFSEYGFLKPENALLKDRVSLLENAGAEKNRIIALQQEQIEAFGWMIAKKDAMLLNDEQVIKNLKRQVATEQKGRKKWMVIGVGVVVIGVVAVVVK
jgi:hypothetical protein